MAKPMAMEEFKKTAEWHQLSARQKFWIETYLASGSDRELATNCSYGTTTGESARTFSYQVVRQKKIQAALNRYFNKGAREIFIDQLLADIKRSKPGSAANTRLRALYAQMVFGKKSSKKQKKETQHV